MQLLRRALRQVDEPVLHRQLEEATQKQSAIEQRADAALERAENLTRMELFPEAALLLEEQSPGVKRLPRVDQALGRARKLQEAEADFAALTGRCYAQMGTTQGIADLKRALALPASSDSPSVTRDDAKSNYDGGASRYMEKRPPPQSPLPASCSARMTAQVRKPS